RNVCTGSCGYSGSTRLLPLFLTAAPSTWYYTLSLHDALPISRQLQLLNAVPPYRPAALPILDERQRGTKFVSLEPKSVLNSPQQDRKSTRLNSSHRTISYAVFCLKKKTTHRGDGKG